MAIIASLWEQGVCRHLLILGAGLKCVPCVECAMGKHKKLYNSKCMNRAPSSTSLSPQARQEAPQWAVKCNRLLGKSWVAAGWSMHGSAHTGVGWDWLHAIHCELLWSKCTAVSQGKVSCGCMITVFMSQWFMSQWHISVSCVCMFTVWSRASVTVYFSEAGVARNGRESQSLLNGRHCNTFKSWNPMVGLFCCAELCWWDYVKFYIGLIVFACHSGPMAI